MDSSNRTDIAQSIPQTPKFKPLAPPVHGITDEWWSDHIANMQAQGIQPTAENKHLWDIDKAQKYIDQGEIEGRKALKEHTGWFANYRLSKPNTWATPFLGKQVDNEWLQRQHAQKTSSDPLKAARQAAFSRALTQRSDEYLNAQSRRASAGMHIAGNVWEGTIPGMVVDTALRMSGKGGYTKAVTGRSVNEHAGDYGQAAGEKAEKWLRGVGFGAYAVPAAASWYAGGQLMSAAGPISAMPKVVQPLATFASSARVMEPLAGITERTGNMWGGTTEQVTGAASTVMRSIPAFSGVHSALGLTGSAIKGTQIGGKAIHAISGTKAAQAVKPFVNWTKTPTSFVTDLPPNTNWLSGGLTLAGRALKAAPVTLGKAVGRLAIWDVTLGPIYGLVDFMQAKFKGEKPSLSQAALGSSVIVSSALGLGRAAVESSDTLAPMLHSGEFSRQHQDFMQAIEDDPAVFRGIQQEYKQLYPDSPPLSVEEAKAVASVQAVQLRTLDTQEQELRLLDPAADWANMTDAQYKQHMATFSQEQRNEARYAAYRSDVVRGGPLMSMMFADRTLSQDQRKNLLELYIRAEDDAAGGTLVGQGLRSLVKGKESIVIDAMKVSESAKSAVIAYAAGTVADILEKPDSKTRLDKDSYAVLEELTTPEIQEIMAPVQTASAEQIWALQKAGKLGTIPDNVRKYVEDAVMQRLQTDGQFSAEFIPLFLGGLKSGQNLSDKDMSRWTAMVSNLNVHEMMSSMDDKSFSSLLRYFSSDKGQEALAGTQSGQMKEIVKEVKAAAGDRMKQAFSTNPLGALPMISSLWFASKGWDTMADAASNPILFYGAVALLMGGAVWLGSSLSGKDEEDEVGAKYSLGIPGWQDDASLLRRRDRQQELMYNAYNDLNIR